jgi:hypothetical protein
VERILQISRAFAVVLIGCTTRAPVLSDLQEPRPTTARSACGDDDVQAGTVCLERIEGRVLTESAVAPQAVFASVCSASLCIPAPVQPDGSFTSEIGRWALPNTFTIHVDGRPQFADAYVRVPLAAKGLFTLSDPIVLVELPADGPALPDETSRASRTFSTGAVSLELPAGAQFQFSAADVDPASRKFRAARARSTSPFLSVFAFGPFGAHSEQSFTVTLPLPDTFKNDGAPVEVWTLSDDSKNGTAGTYLRETQRATVTADGKHANITLNTLSYVALKETP